MATVQIAFGGAMGGGAPVVSPIPNSAQTMASSGSSQASTIEAVGGDYATIAADGNIYVAFGVNPDAENTEKRYLITGGSSRSFGPMRQGDKAAIVDA